MSNPNVKIEQRYRFPWFRPWKVDQMSEKPGNTVSWSCDDSDFVVMFPSNHNPLAGSNEVYGKKGTPAQAQIKPQDQMVKSGAEFYYCILLVDAVDIGEGGSPPKMIIE